MTQTNDEKLIRLAHSASGPKGLLDTVTYRMAVERMAALGYFYQVETDRFVKVEG